METVSLQRLDDGKSFLRSISLSISYSNSEKFHFRWENRKEIRIFILIKGSGRNQCISYKCSFSWSCCANVHGYNYRCCYSHRFISLLLDFHNCCCFFFPKSCFWTNEILIKPWKLRNLSSFAWFLHAPVHWPSNAQLFICLPRSSAGWNINATSLTLATDRSNGMNGRQKCILGLKRKRSNQCDHPQCPAVRQERDIYEFDEEDDEPVPNKFCRTQKLKRKPQKKEWPIIKPVANKVSQRREKKYTIRVKNPRNAPICPKLSAAIGPSSSTNKILENLLKINSKKSKVNDGWTLSKSILFNHFRYFCTVESWHSTVVR